MVCGVGAPWGGRLYQAAEVRLLGALLCAGDPTQLREPIRHRVEVRVSGEQGLEITSVGLFGRGEVLVEAIHKKRGGGFCIPFASFGGVGFGEVIKLRDQFGAEVCCLAHGMIGRGLRGPA